MPILLALLGAMAGAYFWMNRARDAANMAGDIAGMAQNAMGAARRFGFRRQANKHPVDCIEDSNLAVGGLGVAFVELAGVPTAEQHNDLLIGLQSALEISLTDAEELAALGHWFVQECQGPQPGFNRLAKRLRKLSGPQGLLTFMEAIKRLTKSENTPLSQYQIEALNDLQRVFRVT